MDELMTQEVKPAMMERFFASLDLAERSIETYRKALRQFERWILERGYKTPGRTEIVQFKQYLNEKMGPLAVNTYLTALRRFFGWLEAEKIYPDVTRGVKGCKRPRGFRKDALSPDEARRLLEAMKNKSLLDYAVICLMLYGGLREIEIVRANVEDIGYTEGKHVLRVWGKGRDFADEIIVLVEETHKAILAYLAQRGATSGALFVNYKGQRITTRSIRRIVTAALETVGLKTKRITGHSLRHSAATLALIGGADLLSVKELLRHSSLDTVLCYAHNLNRLKKPAEEAIAKVLSGQ